MEQLFQEKIPFAVFPFIFSQKKKRRKNRRFWNNQIDYLAASSALALASVAVAFASAAALSTAAPTVSPVVGFSFLHPVTPIARAAIATRAMIFFIYPSLCCLNLSARSNTIIAGQIENYKINITILSKKRVNG
jgi:hypothetical protein